MRLRRKHPTTPPVTFLGKDPERPPQLAGWPFYFIARTRPAWRRWLPVGRLILAILVLHEGVATFSWGASRPGVTNESMRSLAAPVRESSSRVTSTTKSAGTSERAQNMKLRRRSSGLKFSAPADEQASTEQAVENTEPEATPAPKAARPAKSAAATKSSPAAKSTTAKTSKSAKPEVAKTTPAATQKFSAAKIKKPSTPESSKVIPVVKYEPVKARSSSSVKPAVDVFSDPFGDEAETAKQPASLKPVPASKRPAYVTKRASKTTKMSEAAKVVEDDANPFADDEPIERLVQESTGRRGEEDNQVPSFEENLAQGPQARLAPCPSPDELKRIREIKADIVSKSTDLPPECTLGDAVYQPRQFAPTTYTWKASALCHKPLYFEDVALERYGHSWGPILQPLVSGGRFFATLPILPYEMGIEPPCECVYVLGYYRPGSCAPYMIFPVPLSIRGGLVEAGAVVGAVFVIP